MNRLAIIPLFVVTGSPRSRASTWVFLWMRDERSPLMLLGAAASLALFAWLRSFHPNAGKAYAAYGGMYVAAAVIWGWLVEKTAPDR